MKIVKNEWQKFVLWMTVLSAIMGAVRDKGISFSVAGLFGCILNGLIAGSIIYGIWYAIIGRRKKLSPPTQASQSKWDIIKDNLKIIGFILLVLFVLGIIISIVAILLVHK